jgi:Domain of unknown function (DUF3391)
MPFAKKRQKIDTNKLRVGMYVIIPISCDEHPFLVNRFRISSPSQIDKKPLTMPTQIEKLATQVREAMDEG